MIIKSHEEDPVGTNTAVTALGGIGGGRATYLLVFHYLCSTERQVDPKWWEFWKETYWITDNEWKQRCVPIYRWQLDSISVDLSSEGLFESAALLTLAVAASGSNTIYGLTLEQLDYPDGHSEYIKTGG